MVRGPLACGVLIAGLAGCELVAGIGDKTLVDAGAVTQPDVYQPVVEAGTDAPPTSPEPDVGCAQQPGTVLFCDDFDMDAAGSSPAGKLWDWTNVTDGTMALSQANPVSPPNDAVFAFHANADSIAQLGKNGVSSDPSWTLKDGFRVAFDVRTDGPLDGIGQCGVVQLQVGSMTYNYAFVPGNAIVQIWNASGLRNTLTLPAPQQGSWNRVVMAYDTATGLTVDVNGASAANDPTPAGAPGLVQYLIVGNVYVSPPVSAPLEVELDNIVLRGN